MAAEKQTQSYIICATPRSGSTLLCDLLTETGVAGCPDSFFRRESISWWADHSNVSTSDWDDDHEFGLAYLVAMQKLGLGETEVFGMRLMWESVDDLNKRLKSLYPDLDDDRARFQNVFGPARYIYLSREDIVAQAVSYLRAEQTGLWHVHTDGSERERLKKASAPVYDAPAILALVVEIEDHNAAWLNWFTRWEIEPLWLTYEALSSEPQITLASVLSALDLDTTIASTVAPKSAKLADSESVNWATRFRAEQQDFST